MLIGLISDTHGYRELADQAAELFSVRDVDRIIHAGDVTEPKHIEDLLEIGVPIHLTYGNCDINKTGFQQAEAHSPLQCVETETVLDLDGHSIAFTHGHFDRILNRLIADRPDYVIHGHTHERRDQHFEGTHIINPGAVKPPEPSVACLNLNEDEVSFHELKN